MAFCKICSCGEKIIFDKPLGFPNNCPSCGRRLVDFMTYNENDPRVDELVKGNAETENTDTVEQIVSDKMVYKSKKYYLQLGNGKEIEIPEEGCIIGRTEVGAEELAEFPSVSRQHLRITPRRKIGVLVEDISSYGTLIDGKRIAKNSPVKVTNGAKITLCDIDTVLIIKEGDD